MKRKFFCGLSAIFIMTAAFGCGLGGASEGVGSAGDRGNGEDVFSSAVGGAPYHEDGQGEVLNIYCPDEEFKALFTAYYPGYTEGEDGEMIGDVKVVFHVSSGDDDVYIMNLFSAFEEDEDKDDAAEKEDEYDINDRIDMFILKADYIGEFLDGEYAIPLDELGFTEDEVSAQFQYTKDAVTDSEGRIKGVSWQICPGVLMYNRDIAKEVFEAEEPSDVHKYVRDWEAFKETAGIMKAAGYHMTASVDDTYTAYSQSALPEWISEKGELTVEPCYTEWAADTLEMVNAGQTDNADMFSLTWEAGMRSATPVFCYPCAPEYIRKYMHEDEEGYVANAGRWAVTSAPSAFYAGGSWIFAAGGTDNAGLCADIMSKLTCNEEIMGRMAEDTGELVNNRTIMEKLSDESYDSEVFGGQNPIGLYVETADKITAKGSSAYDYMCTQEYHLAMKNCFRGYATVDEALGLFKTTIIERYPELGAQEEDDE